MGSRTIRRTYVPGTIPILGSDGFSLAEASSLVTDGQVMGWLKDATNTGLASRGLVPADLTAWAGGNTVPAGTNVNRVRFGSSASPRTSTLVIQEGAVVDEFIVYSNASPAVEFRNQSGTAAIGGTVKNGSVRCMGTSGELLGFNAKPQPAVGNGNNITIQNVDVSGGTIGIWCDAAGLIEDLYIYDQLPETGQLQHRDGFTRRDGNSVLTLRRCRIVTDQNSTTGAFFLQDTFGGGVSNLRVYDSSFEGTGYNALLENSDLLIFNNNRFRSYSAHGGTGFGTVSNSGSTFSQWVDNYVWNSANPDYKGAVINQP